MRHLSLFTGVGGGDLAHQHLLGWTTVGYVEFDKYCQQVLAQRIKDGFLHKAPIFGDIDHFIESGAAKKYQGYIDVVTAGFPCQPFSVAGKQAGEEDPRNKWPQTIQCIRDIRPRYAFLENVPGLLNSGYFPEILGSLAEAGFDARWIVLGADDVGAPHRRKRLWILAHTISAGTGDNRGSIGDKGRQPTGAGAKTLRQAHWSPSPSWSYSASEDVADSDSDDGWTGSGTVAQGRGSRLEHRRGSTGQSVRRPGEDVADPESKPGNGGDDYTRVSMEGGQESQLGNSSWPSDVADSDEQRLQGSIRGGQARKEKSPGGYVAQCGEDVADTDSERGRCRETDRQNAEDAGQLPRRSEHGFWDAEPQLGRVADGVAHRVDRLKAIGNGQVSRVAATAWHILNDPNG